MKSLNDCINVYRAEMQKGDIPRAYRGIIDFMLMLRTHFRNNYPELSVSGNIYQGYMDITFLTLFPISFEAQKLKIALVFNHERINFEAWLCGINNQVKTKYTEIFTKGTRMDYRIPPFTHSQDSLLECDLSSDPDFDQPQTLTKELERGVWQFVGEVEHLLYQAGL